jgi:THO complex subunit 4
LDDIIKQGRPRRGGGGVRGRGPNRFRNNDNRTGGGAFRRTRNTNTRSAPYRTSKLNDDMEWKHDKFDGDVDMGDGRAAQPTSPVVGIETGTKLLVSNLDFNVSDDDIKDLFESIGDVKRAYVHYDKSGRSLGTATVVYTRREDAHAAIKKYNNVPLDGKPMKISLVGTNVLNPEPSLAPTDLRATLNEASNLTISVEPRQRRIIANGGPRTRRLTTVRSRFGGSARGRGGRGGRGRGRGGRGRGSGRQVYVRY